MDYTGSNITLSSLVAIYIRAHWTEKEIDRGIRGIEEVDCHATHRIGM